MDHEISNKKSKLRIKNKWTPRPHVLWGYNSSDASPVIHFATPSIQQLDNFKYVQLLLIFKLYAIDPTPKMCSLQVRVVLRLWKGDIQGGTVPIVPPSRVSTPEPRGALPGGDLLMCALQICSLWVESRP